MGFGSFLKKATGIDTVKKTVDVVKNVAKDSVTNPWGAVKGSVTGTIDVTKSAVKDAVDATKESIDMTKDAIKTVGNAVNSAVGNLNGSSSTSDEQYKLLQQQMADQAAANAKQLELANQTFNRNNQKDPNNGALQAEDQGGGHDTIGVLTGVGGTDEDQKLLKKNKLGR